MKHLLVIRKRPDTQDFVRCDYYNGAWVQYKNNGQVLHALLPSIKDEIESSKGNVAVTLSSCRDGDAFINPENSSIEDDVATIVLAPIDDAVGEAIADNMRLWVTLTWRGPDHPPVRGEKIRQSALSSFLDNFFIPEQLEQWKTPRGGVKTEIWIRPDWNVVSMFPEIFPREARARDIILPEKEPEPEPAPLIVNDVKEPEGPFVVPIRDDGKPVVHTSWTKQTKWRFSNIDGKTESVNFKTKQDAESAMHLYLIKNNLILPEGV